MSLSTSAPDIRRPPTRPGHGRLPGSARAGLAAAVPVALGAILALHPMMSLTDPFAIDGVVTRWFVVHYGLLLLLPPLTWVAWHTFGDLQGGLVTVGRAALLPFAVLVGAYDALAGIGTGWLVQSAAETDPTVQAVVLDWWTSLNPHWIAIVGMGAWGVFAVCAFVAHRRAGAHPAVLWGLGISVLYAVSHGSAPATVALLGFAAAVWQLERSRT